MRIKTGADWELARRDVLKYVGVGAACLPLLSASRAKGAASAAQRTMIIIHTSEGYRQQYWKPTAAGPLGALPDSLAPLEKHKADLIVMPDLNNIGFGSGASGGHGSYGSTYYGLEPGKISYKKPNGNTFDQEIAVNLPKLPSGRPTLPLAVQLDRSPQSEPSKPASSHCFFLKGQPINPILNPYQVYNEIFAGGAPAPSMGMPSSPADMAATEKLMLRKKSILDYVGKNLDAFKMRLGKQDQMAIDAHHESVRELEQQLQSAGQVGAGGGGKCSPKATPMIDITDGSKYPDILDAHLWLLVSALGCGITRIGQLQLSDSSGNNINFAFVPGVPPKGTGYKTAFRNYHDLGHNPVLGGTDHKRIVDKWMMQQMATLIDRMKAIPTPEGTLFSNSIVLFGNHMQDGSNHDGNHLPWISAGNLGGYFKTGICLPDHQPSTGFMGEVCTAFGVKSPYGESMADIRA